MGITWNNHQLPVQQPRNQGGFVWKRELPNPLVNLLVIYDDVRNCTCYLVGLPHFQTHPRLLYWTVKTGCLRPSIFNGQSIFCYTAVCIGFWETFKTETGRCVIFQWRMSQDLPGISIYVYIHKYIYIYVCMYDYVCMIMYVCIYM